MGKCTRGCACKNKALITLVSCEIWRDISLAISHVDSCNKSYNIFHSGLRNAGIPAPPPPPPVLSAPPPPPPAPLQGDQANVSLDRLHQMQSRLRSRIKKVPAKGTRSSGGSLEEKDTDVDIKVWIIEARASV